MGDPRVSQKAEPDSIRADFGANEWLVDELYEQYLKDKNAALMAKLEANKAMDKDAEAELNTAVAEFKKSFA